MEKVTRIPLKIAQFYELGVGGNFTNYLKHFLQQMYNSLDPLVNSAFNATQKVISFLVKRASMSRDRCSNLSGSVSEGLNSKQLFEQTVSTDFSIYTKCINILLMVNKSNLPITVNRNRYRQLIGHLWRQNPDSL